MKSAIKRTRHLWTLVTLAALLVLLAQSAHAAGTKYWVGPNPNVLWTNPNNWSNTAGGPPGAGQPISGDEVNLTSTSNKTAVYDTTLNPLLSALTIDATGGGTFTLSQSANALTIQFGEFIGESGKGQVVQSGGTHSDSALILGGNMGSSGTYTLSGGASLSSINQDIGFNGTGLFNQNGGSNTVGINPATDFLTLGFNPNGVGTYNLSGGHLTAQNEVVGLNGTGTFNQSTGSTNIVSNLLSVGGSNVMGVSGTGTYTMKGGYLQANQEIVGNYGKGTFTQKGGTHQISNAFVLGFQSTGNGAFNLLAGDLSADTETIGRDGTGQFTQSGGTNTVANNLTIGNNAGSNGTYTLNAGNLNASFNEFIGYIGTGTFTQNGGTHTVYNNLILGDTATGNGTYNLVKGNLNVTGNEIIGNNGTGTFTQIGGTHTANFLYVGNGTGSTGTFNLQGGTLSVTHFILMRDGTFNVKNTTTTVTGLLDNRKVVTTTNANVTWNSRVISIGAYISQNSTQTFNSILQVAYSGYLVGGSQDVFIVKDDFINQSSNQDQWNTVLSTLKFVTGADNSHDLWVAGVDNGPHGQASNFTWGTLNLTGQKLVLFDGNTTNPSTALYAEAVIGATFSGNTLTDITNADANPINIYYNVHLAANAYLGGLSYTIPGGGGGMLIAHAPVPPSVLLLGSGLLGLGALGWRRKRG